MLTAPTEPSPFADDQSPAGDRQMELSGARRGGHLRSISAQAALIFAGLAAVYLATANYHAAPSRDTLTAAVASWALATHHTVNLSFLTMPHILWTVPGPHGTLVSNRFPGAVLLALPAYALGGGSHFSLVPAAVVSALTAAGACALLYLVLRRVTDTHTSLAGTLLFAFATSNWTVSARELWQHGGSELVLAAGMLAFLTRRWALSGLAFGAAVLFRPHLGVACLVVAGGLLWAERRWRPAVVFLLAALPGAALLLVWNGMVYGRVTVTGGYSDVSAGGVGPGDFLLNLAGSLVSPERGLLVYTPVLLLAALGLPAAWRTAPPAVRILALAGVGYLASQLWLIRFSGGDGFFGYRTPLEALLLAAPLLVLAGRAGAARTGPALAWALAAASVAIFSSTAFVPGGTSGADVNPWTHWSPAMVAGEYGLGRVVIGALFGLAAVLLAGLVAARSRAERRQASGLLPGLPALDRGGAPV